MASKTQRKERYRALGDIKLNEGNFNLFGPMVISPGHKKSIRLMVFNAAKRRPLVSAAIFSTKRRLEWGKFQTEFSIIS